MSNFKPSLTGPANKVIEAGDITALGALKNLPRRYTISLCPSIHCNNMTQYVYYIVIIVKEDYNIL